MLHRPSAIALLALVAWASPRVAQAQFFADTIYETAYVPTSSILGLPGSSVLSTSYVVPTAYSTTLPPTAYLPTTSVISSGSALVPTSTTYYRSGFFRPRRYVERTSYRYAPTSYLMPTTYLAPASYVAPTSYLSTSYLLPTTYLSSSYITPSSYLLDTALVTTSASYPCETSSSQPSTRSTTVRPSTGAGGNTITSEPSNLGVPGERKPSAVLNSSPMPEEGIPSNVPPAPPGKPAAVDTKTPPEPITGPDPNNLNIPEPGKSGAGSGRPGETSFRQSQRPAYDVRNILRGRVVSAESRQPEEGVMVIVSSITKNFSDRPAMTDADGAFKVSLPDGDWTVKVKMPSGSIFTVGRDFLTASNGKVTDSSGRSVADFLITR